jgi:hypothetical protein
MATNLKTLEARMLIAIRTQARSTPASPTGGVHLKLSWLARRKPPLLLRIDFTTNKFSGDESYSFEYEEVGPKDPLKTKRRL